jgi:cysteine desulfurase
MLLTSRVSRSLITRRAALRKPHTPVLASAKRTYVQPSGADRASVVDIPSTYEDESHFAPRAGNSSPFKPTLVIKFLTDMLGFKLELPQREDGITKKARPIYLDMQVKDMTSSCITAVF